MSALPRKISLVDDDEAVRDSLRALLESYGIAVAEYPTAHDFLSNARNDRSDCLLLDLHMPDMNGLQLLDAMREQGSPMPVIMISGRGDAQLTDRAIRAGAYALLSKPIEDDVLLQSIRDAVADKRPAELAH
jgi:two-component system response regulator FixJ